jgi:hypothetical protein
MCEFTRRWVQAVYLARFSYDIDPGDRDAAVDLIGQEVAAAADQGLSARLLVPLTRGPGGASLQFEVELTRLDQLESLRNRGFGSERSTNAWAERMAQILKCPPQVEILRIAERPA